MYSHFWRSLSEFIGVFRTQSSIWDKAFMKKLLPSFAKKLHRRYTSLNTSLGLFFYTVYLLLEFQHNHESFLQKSVLFSKYIQAEEQQLYKTELLYLYLPRIYRIFQYLSLIYCQNPKWGWKSVSGEHLSIAASEIFLLKF